MIAGCAGMKNYSACRICTPPFVLGDIHQPTVGARAMMQQGGTAEGQIKAIIDAWADAVRRHDLSGILAHHEHDIVMFDVPPPLQSRGMDEHKKTWDLFFRYHTPSQAFDIEELAITAGENVAFVVAIMRCGLRHGQRSSGGRRVSVQADNRTAQHRWRLAYRARASLRALD